MITNTCGVYKITNVITGKFYIGSSVNLGQRFVVHRSELARNTHCNCHLQNSWNKYGKQNFTFETVELCEKERLIEREQFYIDRVKPAYNMCPVAGNCMGVKHTEDSKRHMSEAQKRRAPASDETRAKLSEAMKGKTYALGHKCTDGTKRRMSEVKTGERNPFFGHSHSEESKQKISGENNVNFGKHPSEETIRKRSGENNCNFGKHSANFGKPMSEEQKQKITGENNHNFGKHHSDETRRKNSEAHKGCVFTEEHKQKISEAGKGERNSNFGKHISEEQKRQISAAHKGKHISEEQKRKMSETRLANLHRSQMVLGILK